MKYQFLVCLLALVSMVHCARHPLAELHRSARIVSCPGGRGYCPDRTTCCKLSDGDIGCCPLPNAVCCPSRTHCCPDGYTCGSGTCIR